MQKISKLAIGRARKFVEANARPLDRAYLDYLLPTEATPDARERVIEELQKFQTPEGGFAHGIEPDVRTPAPSAISTSVVFQYLREINADAALPIVKTGIDYLIRALDRERWVWRIIDERVEEGPHAPWWNLPNLAERFNGFVFNPSAELLGYLCDYRLYVPDDIIAGVEAVLINTLEKLELIADPYDLHCSMRLFRSKALPARLRELLEPKLLASIEAADLNNQHLDFMALVPSPSSFGYAAAHAGIELQAERLLTSQAADGGWHPFWDWSEVDADAWREAEREWSGVLTRHAIVGFSSHQLSV
jgi:hypothetical protein